MILQDIISAVPMACLVIDRKETLILANDRAKEIFGHGIENLHFINTFRQPDIVAAVEAAIHDQSAHDMRWRTVNAGVDIVYDVIVRPITGGHILVCFNDVTQSERTQQMRRDFVSNVSHELKTPLTSILGFLETLQTVAKHDPKAQERFVQLMKAEAERMSRLVSDLMSLNRVENNERSRPSDRVDIKAVIAQTVENLSPLVEKSNTPIRVTVPNDPVVMIGDFDQLRQVITNLIENAIKYGGPNKEIQVSVSDIGYQAALRATGVMISVRDNGAGIAAEHLHRLTERFYRVDDHRSRDVGGTGLGLSIVKHILSRHRGRLTVNSVLGEGSTFSIFLPAE